MQLIGMLDSPYVRRVAISLQFLGLPFEHRAVSVFRHFDQFRQINPVVKAPSLICDDGEVLMDSTLILDYAETLAAPRSLMAADVAARKQALKIIGLALAACEKSVQIVYERELRPAEKRHEPWLARISGQLRDAYDALEAIYAGTPKTITAERVDQADISTAVAWQFTRQMIPDVLDARAYPALLALSQQAEALSEFRKAPHGLGTYPTPL